MCLAVRGEALLWVERYIRVVSVEMWKEGPAFAGGSSDGGVFCACGRHCGLGSVCCGRLMQGVACEWKRSDASHRLMTPFELVGRALKNIEA